MCQVSLDGWKHRWEGHFKAEFTSVHYAANDSFPHDTHHRHAERMAQYFNNFDFNVLASHLVVVGQNMDTRDNARAAGAAPSAPLPSKSNTVKPAKEVEENSTGTVQPSAMKPQASSFRFRDHEEAVKAAMQAVTGRKWKEQVDAVFQSLIAGKIIVVPPGQNTLLKKQLYTFMSKIKHQNLTGSTAPGSKQKSKWTEAQQTAFDDAMQQFKATIGTKMHLAELVRVHMATALGSDMVLTTQQIYYRMVNEAQQKPKSQAHAERNQHTFPVKSLEHACARFADEKWQGPEHMCSCCDRIWFWRNLHKVTKITMDRIEVDDPELYKSMEANEEDEYRYCDACANDLSKMSRQAGRRPAHCKLTGTRFKEIPRELSMLNEMEARLIAPYVIFAQMRELCPPWGKHGKPLTGLGQHCMVGRAVTVPANLEKIQQVLPRTHAESRTIGVVFKRKVRYTGGVLAQNIRPALVMQAMAYLVQQKLFQEEHISIRNDWTLLEGDADSQTFEPADRIWLKPRPEKLPSTPEAEAVPTAMDTSDDEHEGTPSDTSDGADVAGEFIGAGQYDNLMAST